LDSCSAVEYRGIVDLLGIRFRPAGAYPFFSCAQSELSGQILSLDDVLPGLVRLVQQEAGPERPFADRIAALERFLLTHLLNAPKRDYLIEQAVLRFEESRGLVSISAVASACQLSNRQFERRFEQVVGLRPKLLCRILRFQQVWQLVTKALRRIGPTSPFPAGITIKRISFTISVNLPMLLLPASFHITPDSF